MMRGSPLCFMADVAVVSAGGTPSMAIYLNVSAWQEIVLGSDRSERYHHFQSDMQSVTRVGLRVKRRA